MNRSRRPVRRVFLQACAATALAACSAGGDAPPALPSAVESAEPLKGASSVAAPVAPGAASMPVVDARTAAASTGAVAAVEAVVPKAVVLNASLRSPWGLAFLPDGRMLVTEKAGRLLILAPDGARVEAVVAGVPEVAAFSQGGLLDVALDPGSTAEAWVYLTFAEAGTGDEAGLYGTAVARGRLVGDALQDVSVVYRQVPKVSGGGHYGARLAFAPDGTLYVALGERQKGSPAQDPTTSLGKVVRIARDGTVPAGNPGLPGARPEVFSLGHRNPQGAAIHPATGELWITEHGAQGGDELNRIVAGGDYGWPSVSYGCNYGDPVGESCRIGGGTHAPAYVEPVATWVPVSIAPAGLLFYTGDRFPQWRGSVLMGALAGAALWRVELDGQREVARERLFAELGERIRDVRQGPDGWVYLLTDSGKLIQVRD
jgi:glucose/arabinose dehydrogenase